LEFRIGLAFGYRHVMKADRSRLSRSVGQGKVFQDEMTLDEIPLSRE